MKRTELAALASDTWGCEVRPNETEPGINQPWHWITIPIMGMTMGEIFQVKELADDCAADGVYEFLFVAPAIPITGAVGSPVNPLAIKYGRIAVVIPAERACARSGTHASAAAEGMGPGSLATLARPG